MSEDMIPSVKATVALHEGETSHWEVNADGDLQVSVVTHGHGAPITALLGALVGGNGKGVWVIPPIGTEVLVAFPDGDYEGDAVLVAVLSTGSVPAGLVDGNVVIVGVEVLVHDGPGGAVPLARKSDVDALSSRFDAHRVIYNAHTHAYLPGPDPAIPTAVPVATDPTPTPTPAGTTVLKGK